MVNLRQQRRLAAEILRVGKGRVWMDPNEVNEIALANSRKAVRKLIKDNFIFKKKIQIHSRQRALLRKQERRLGRHTGLGKRRGCSDGRMPKKVLWIRRQRTLRRLLKKYREGKNLLIFYLNLFFILEPLKKKCKSSFLKVIKSKLILFK